MRWGRLMWVIFGTARTVSRVALQMVQMVNNTFWPEMSVAFGQKNASLTRTLHRRACQMALILAAVVVAGMMTVGPWFLSHWTGGHVPPSRGLLSILLLVVVFYALWSTSSTLLTAINRHQRLAAVVSFRDGDHMRDLLCGSAAVTGCMGRQRPLLVSEAVMTVYVLPVSLRIADDQFGEFVASMAEWPRVAEVGSRGGKAATVQAGAGELAAHFVITFVRQSVITCVILELR